MNPETISFEVPPNLLAALKIGSDDFKRHRRLMAAIAVTAHADAADQQ
ncbi:hypothetical protein [Almyronema epifaneia]|uniref:CopG family transcriptional regulator n=1 Tax=Almyronema epifaneia S1 TaxID=2991925 RepID=A0ABW6ICD3_9CYAN